MTTQEATTKVFQIICDIFQIPEEGKYKFPTDILQQEIEGIRKDIDRDLTEDDCNHIVAIMVIKCNEFKQSKLPK